MRPHVRKIVDSHVEPARHTAERIAHGAVVPAQRPKASCSMARQNDVHRASRADGALELAPTTPDVAAVYGSGELGLDWTTEEGQLHRHRSNVIINDLGAMSFCERSNRIDVEFHASCQSSYRGGRDRRSRRVARGGQAAGGAFRGARRG